MVNTAFSIYTSLANTDLQHTDFILMLLLSQAMLFLPPYLGRTMRVKGLEIGLLRCWALPWKLQKSLQQYIGICKFYILRWLTLERMALVTYTEKRSLKILSLLAHRLLYYRIAMCTII